MLSVALLSTPVLAGPPKVVVLSQSRKLTDDPNAPRAMPDWAQLQVKLEERIDAMQEQLTATQQQLATTQAALVKAQDDMQQLQTRLATHTHKVRVEHVDYENRQFLLDRTAVTLSVIRGVVPDRETTYPPDP
ncbi:hypothetical protein GCM10027430_06510 [Lysobacter tyrosinilyticus]